MAESTRDKWNRIYSSNTTPGEVACVLRDNASLLPDQGSALDIACGSGGNALFLAQRGLQVEAWDISDVIINALDAHKGDLPVHTCVVDIVATSFQDRQFDVIVNCHYLDRSLTTPMLASLSAGGLIFFQTFMRNRLTDSGPGNPDFLLEDGELREMMSGLDVLSERDGSKETDPDHPLAGRAYIVARKPT